MIDYILQTISRSSPRQILNRSLGKAAMSLSPLSAKKSRRERLVWIDCEMSGLDVHKEHLLEVACIVTDAELITVAEGPNVIIHQPDTVLDSMGEWCTEQHGRTGLTQAVRDSKVSLRDAEQQLVEFVRQHVNTGTAPLAGNTVHADKQFLDKYMPELMGELHYRIVDVSTVKELCRRWYGREFSEAPKKSLSHRALDDIRESIAELKYYREAIFKKTDNDERSQS